MRDERNKDAQTNWRQAWVRQAKIRIKIAQVVLDGEMNLRPCERVARCLELPKQQLECQHLTVKRSRFKLPPTELGDPKFAPPGLPFIDNLHRVRNSRSASRWSTDANGSSSAADDPGPSCARRLRLCSSCSSRSMSVMSWIGVE